MPQKLRSTGLLGNRLFGQLCRFALVGLANTLLSYLLYTALVAARVPYTLAGAIGFTAGAINGYILNRRWTFASPDSRRARSRYLIVQLAGLGATSAMLWLVVSAGATSRLTAYAVTIPIVTLATFSANRSWAFAGICA
ncbi:MAG TPA: GtrA family protein [Solirubrobacteraceae bacterium]|nr:GtrA family protein [Solirubrobacteraceae bacterium]